MRRRWRWILLLSMGIITLRALPLGAEEDLLSRVQICLLDGDISRAIDYGEKELARYKFTAPPAELYYFLALAYAKKGDKLRAEDICNLLLDEYKLDDCFRGRVKVLRFFIAGGQRPELEECKGLVELLESVKVSSRGTDQVVYQVGAFSARRNAERLVDELSKKGIKCFIVYEDGLYKVRFVGGGALNRYIEKMKSTGLNLGRVSK